MTKATFTTNIKGDGNNTGIEVPPEIIAQLGTSKKPAVVVTVNGFTYRNTVAVMGGLFMISLSKERREAAGVKTGDKVEVTLELDTAPREVVVPPDFQAALDQDAEAKRFFESLSYSNKSRHVLSVEGTKNPETRQRRIEKAIETLRAGKK
jgi:hypothetical protein